MIFKTVFFNKAIIYLYFKINVDSSQAVPKLSFCKN